MEETTNAESLARGHADAERLGHRLATVDRAPRASGSRAHQVDADEHACRRGREQHEVPRARVVQDPAAELRRVDHDAGGKAPLGLVLVADVDHDEMQRERRHCEVEAAQPQARQAEDDAEGRADRGGGGERHPELRSGLLEEDSGRERARCEQPGVAERDLSRVAGEQHQRHRADRGEQHLVGELERERPGDEGERERRGEEGGEPRFPGARVEEREVALVAGAEIAARAGLGHTRSSSSRVPNSPHGRTASIASRTKNGTTSESSGST